MFFSVAQYFFAGLLATTFTPACSPAETPHATASNLTGAVFVEHVPASEQGDDAMANMRRMDRAGRANGGQLAELDPLEHMRRAAVYHANRAFAEAREHWQTLIARYPKDSNVPAALFGMGRSLYQERRYADALPFFDKLGRGFPQQKEGREGFYYVAATLLRLDREADAATRYGEYVEQYPQGERVENAHLNAIDSWREAGRNEEAVRWIARTRARFRGTATETNALFAGLRLAVAGGDWQSALRATDELRAANFSSGVQTSPSEITYLRGLSLERLKQTTQAAAIYQSIPDRPFSYYGGLATARLGTLDAAGTSPAGRSTAGIRLNAVRREFNAAAAAYPAPYREIILRATAKRNLDPRFVLAIMRQESSFKERARSPAAARGLLQLTIDIATKYGAQAGFKDVREDDLYRPEINIGIGVEYLADLFRMFPALPEAVAASYNGGEDNVARWVRRSGQRDAGVFAAEVGFAESKDYVFKVMANYRAYQQLYTVDLRRQR
ncbi:MAG: transglycosylase SLT domain-containing protein [Pyrinomonadaceae bacterium]